MAADLFKLPYNAIDLLPHRAPMILVDKLLEFDAGDGVVTATIAADNIFVDADGCLEAVALIEIVAQSYAAIKGYDDRLNHRPVQRGFLVGGRSFKIKRCPLVGEQLRITITTMADLDEFSVVDGVVNSADEIIAEGSLKLWLP
ncbi:MAG: hypothetical protein RBR22_09255 [Desulfuromonas sp.]|nr:hypothetical protein [Desulfuromonas sp.]